MSLVCLSSANCLWAFLCIIFRRCFLLGRQPYKPIWCSVRRMVLALTGWPPTPSASAAMLEALIRLFSKHNLWIWRWAHSLNFFGRPWQGLFWVEPVLLNRCMVLATVLRQSSYSLRHLYVEQQLFVSDSQRVLCHEVPCWTSSYQYERVVYKFNTPAPHSLLRPCNTNESWHRVEKMANWAQFGHFHLRVYSLLWPAV